MKAYKVVKRLKNGDRVSPLIPRWHPCYTVYMHQGKVKPAKTAFLYQNLSNANEWVRSLTEPTFPYFEKNDGEILEVWVVDYLEPNIGCTAMSLRLFMDNRIFNRKIPEIRKAQSYTEILKHLKLALCKHSKLRYESFDIDYTTFNASDVKLFEKVKEYKYS